jgi:alpha-galactosidase
VLHPSDSLQRTAYSLAATFLGRMCISGAIEKLPDESWQLTREAIAFYQKCAPVIKCGTSRRFGVLGASWRHPQGWQAVVRSSAEEMLVVLHTFAGAPDEVVIPLPATGELVETFSNVAVTLCGNELLVKTGGDFTGAVFLLRRLA